uniref:DUF4283 domain-containing protein n=1 Tax=Noccaea caerulescens TaxID=107243 RepID=A0A1J3CNP3_NOCCA
MSSAMDKAMLAMSLDEEEDLPFNIPDRPEYSSYERNELSLIGRTLNPDRQKMKNLLLDMPRKWQMYGKVRGVALSSEKFQFIFDSERDLIEILERGVHTYNEWALAIERWVEQPAEDFLQFIPLWMQIWKLPLNHRTVRTILDLGDMVGQVTEVAFDPDLPQLQPYVRVKILLDISRPLRRGKVLNLPDGGSTTVEFDYERVQKRCYGCQHLTHEKEVCPFLLKKRQVLEGIRHPGLVKEQVVKPLIIKPSDPLFGVLSEEQVGINPVKGRIKIAKIVLEGMRQYLMVADEDERKLRIDKVKRTVGIAENDPVARKAVLCLESAPFLSKDVNKKRGRVFGYESSDSTNWSKAEPKGNKLMEEAFKTISCLVEGVASDCSQVFEEAVSSEVFSKPFNFDPTEFRIGFSEAGPSGIKQKKRETKKTSSEENQSPKSSGARFDNI